MRPAIRLLFESFVSKETFEEFCARTAVTPGDLKVWQTLDRAFGDRAPHIRQCFLAAEEAERCRVTALEKYLAALEKGHGQSREQLAELARVNEEKWLSWVLAEDDSVPNADQLERVIAGAGLSAREAAHARELRESAAWHAQPRRLPGLTEYLCQESRSLGPALARVKARKDLSTEAVARLAGVAPTIWLRWEEGLELPSPRTLDEVLKKLHWIWATDDALRGWKDEVPVPRDASLWKAFLNDHEWEETGDQESWLCPEDPSPEAVEAWRQVRLASERRREPDPEAETLRVLAEERERREGTVGDFLRYRRESKLESVESMAGKAGVEVATWIRWESGELVPDLTEVEAMAPRLFVTPWLRQRLVEIWHAMGAAPRV